VVNKTKPALVGDVIDVAVIDQSIKPEGGLLLIYGQEIEIANACSRLEIGIWWQLGQYVNSLKVGRCVVWIGW
jgi:hypothetical protein